MKTYIRKNIKGYYIDFPEEIDAEYWEGKIGTTYEDFQDNKWILLSDEQLAFKEAHPNLSIKNIIEMTEPATHQRTIEDAKFEKLAQIDEYDSSNAVNSFDIVVDGNTISAWLTPDQRANYKNSLDSAELLGLEEVHPVFNEMQLTLQTAMAKMALAQIQLYADRCFIVTQTHKAEVNALDSIEAIDNYSITSGYPEKLIFTL